MLSVPQHVILSYGDIYIYHFVEFYDKSSNCIYKAETVSELDVFCSKIEPFNTIVAQMINIEKRPIIL